MLVTNDAMQKTQAPDVGPPQSVRVRLVERGIGAAWFLSHITVITTPAAGSSTTFRHNGWLQQTKENPAGEVTLLAEQSDTPQARTTATGGTPAGAACVVGAQHIQQAHEQQQPPSDVQGTRTEQPTTAIQGAR